MKLYTKVLLCVLTATSLSACLEVDEDNDGVVSALERQNQLLEEQNARESEPASVTLYGNVVDLATEEYADASVRIKIGPQWSDPVATTDGEFALAGIAPSSNYLLEVASPTDAFLTRAFYGISRYNDDGLAFQEVGSLGVSAGIARSYSIVDQDTNEAVGGLVLKGYSHVSDGLNVEDYAHVSSYNEASGTYDIVVPEAIAVSLRGALDVDGDGIQDYIPVDSQYRSGDDLYIAPNDIETTDTIYLQQTNYSRDLELRVSVIDGNSNNIPGLALSINDELNGDLPSEYDEASQQYILSAKIGDRLQIDVPAFEIDATNYTHSSINISRNTDSFRISTSGSENYRSYNVSSKNSSLNLVIQPRVVITNASLEVLSKTTAVGSDGVVKIHYSGAIELNEDSARLYQRDVVDVVRGNDETDDLVPDGFTLVTETDLELPLDAELSLDNTLLTLTPADALEAGRNYRYEVGNIIETDSGIESDIYGDRQSFSSPLTAPFELASIVLDNGNYTTNGTPIVSQNTAGIASTSRNFGRPTSLYFPPSVRNLNYFVLIKRVVVEGSRTELNNRMITVVDRNGYISRYGQRYAIDVAENEDVTSDVSLHRGTSLSEGFWYAFSTWDYMSDNTESETNTISFEYILERKSGAIETGTLTLPVR